MEPGRPVSVEAASPAAVIGHDAAAPGRGGARARHWIRVPVLLLVPCAALLLGAMVERTAGPRWRWGNADPQYTYLLNSVNIAEGRAPGVYHHPGTPLYTFGAAFLMARHAVTAPGVPLRQSVLADPEDALHDFSVALRVFHAAALLALGIAAVRRTGSVACAVVAQGATLLSLSAITSLHVVAPEPVVLSLGLVLGASVLMCLSRPRPVRTRFGAISGVLVGAGLATKATFAPTALAVWGVLLGPRPRDRGPQPMPMGVGGRWRLPLVHLAAAALALVILLAPLWGQLGTMFRWFRALALHDGGHGRSTGHLIVNLEAYPRQLWLLISAEPVTACVALGAAVLAGALFIPRLARRLDDPGRRARAVLVAVTAAQVLQYLLVAKHMGTRYLLSGVGLSGLAVCLAFVLARAVLLRPWVRRTIVAMALAGLTWGGATVFGSVRPVLEWMRAFTAQQVALAQEADRLGSKPGRPGSGAVLVWTYWSSSPAYALFGGDHWAHLRCHDEVDRMFPDRVLYDAKQRFPFMDGLRHEVTRGRLEEWAAEGRLYFHMKEDELPQGFRYESVVPSGGLYRASVPERAP